MHAMLVNKALEDVSKGLKNFLAEGYSDLCQWRRRGSSGGSIEYFFVDCADKMLKHFQLHNFGDQGNVRYGYFPSTVVRLEIINCSQMYPFESRLLPRDVQNVSFADNVLYGTADLQGLPRKIMRLDLSKNVIGGTIRLSDLPPNLEWLSLNRNKLKADVLRYAELPDSVQQIDLRGNAIHTIRPAMKNLYTQSVICSIFPEMNVR